MQTTAYSASAFSKMLNFSSLKTQWWHCPRAEAWGPVVFKLFREGWGRGGATLSGFAVSPEYFPEPVKGPSISEGNWFWVNEPMLNSEFLIKFYHSNKIGKVHADIVVWSKKATNRRDIWILPLKPRIYLKIWLYQVEREGQETI